MLGISRCGAEVGATGQHFDIPQRPARLRDLPSREYDKGPPRAMGGAADHAEVRIEPMKPATALGDKPRPA